MAEKLDSGDVFPQITLDLGREGSPRVVAGSS